MTDVEVRDDPRVQASPGAADLAAALPARPARGETAGSAPIVIEDLAAAVGGMEVSR